jgi:hypothetical protein
MGNGNPLETRGPRGGRGIALLFLDLGARRGCVVSTTPQPLNPRERPGTSCTGGWVGPRAGLDVCPPRLDPRTIQPVASRYTDWATRPLSLYDEVTNVVCVRILLHDRYQYDSLILSKQTWANTRQRLQQLTWCWRHERIPGNKFSSFLYATTQIVCPLYLRFWKRWKCLFLL